jgi:hypothetical protein
MPIVPTQEDVAGMPHIAGTLRDGHFPCPGRFPTSQATGLASISLERRPGGASYARTRQGQAGHEAMKQALEAPVTAGAA